MPIGAYAIERDYSHYVAHASKTVLALIGTATKGPVNEPLAVTSTQDLVNKFGSLNVNCPALYAAQYFLSQASKLYFVRAAGEDAASGYVDITGIDASEHEIASALKIQMIEKGSFCKGYKLFVTNGKLNGTYTFTLKSALGSTLDVIENKTLDEMTVGFKTDVVEVVAASAQAASLVLGAYVFDHGNDGFDNASIVSAPASVTIPGEVSGSAVTNAAVFEMLQNGIAYNGYTLVLSDGTNSGKKFQVRDFAGDVVETVDDVVITNGFRTNYIQIKDVTSGAEFTNGTYTFAGGHDDVASKYVNAAMAIKSETYDINLLAVPGVSDLNVITPVLQMVEERGDTLYIIDPPKGLTREGVIQWADGTGSYVHAMISSSYGALYYDYLKIYDSINKVNVIVPPSVAVCTTIAYSTRISELWYAPAGLTRGIVSGVIDTVTHLDKNSVELLYEHAINSIYEDPQVGLVLWGQKTLWREATALDRINVRQLMNYLKKVVVAACNNLVFEPNDRVTWNSFEMKITPLLQSIKNRRGIYEYRIIKGETIVTADDIDNYRMPCMIMIRPTKAAEEIPVYFVLTSTGADFNAVLEANGVIEV